MDADEVYEAEGSDEEFEIADEDISIFADFENAEIVDPVEDVTECVHFEEVPQEEAASDATEAPTVGTLYLDVTGEE